jgi:hypothetical protein
MNAATMPGEENARLVLQRMPLELQERHPPAVSEELSSEL